MQLCDMCGRAISASLVGEMKTPTPTTTKVLEWENRGACKGVKVGDLMSEMMSHLMDETRW